VPQLTDDCSLIRVEKLLLTNGLDDAISAAFGEHETRDLQFGLDWLINLATTALDADEEAAIFVARRSAADFIACPMKLGAHRAYAHALSTFYTTTYSPIVASTAPDALFLALFEHLARVERIATLMLYPLAADSPVSAVVRDALNHAGWRGAHDYFCFGNWIHDLEGSSFQSYLAARPSQLRNTVARKTRQFLAAGRGRLELVTGGDALESAIQQFVAIYDASWKRSEPFPDFIPQLLRLSARRGWLRLAIASYDHAPVASQVWLVSAGTAYIFKLAYHQDYGQLSPGTVLTAYLMEHVIDRDRVTRIDYLSGDDSYKRDWMSCRRERRGIAAYNVRTLHGSSQFIGHTFTAFLKKLNRILRDETRDSSASMRSQE